ncbi:MAG TPA: hypothetical protein PLD54_03535, partial [Candidatus Levybacteria bacterium]|nr:hypothetical protein [Candidatus Levybacteria bacterium]
MLHRIKTIFSITTLIVYGVLAFYMLSIHREHEDKYSFIPKNVDAYHSLGAGYPANGTGCTTEHKSLGRTTTITCNGNAHTQSMGWYILKLPRGVSPDIDDCNVNIYCYNGNNINPFHHSNVALNRIYIMGQANGQTASFSFTRPADWNSFSYYILTNFSTERNYDDRWSGRAETKFVCAWTGKVATNNGSGGSRWLSPETQCANPPYPPPPDCTEGCGGTITGRVYNADTNAGIQDVNIEVYKWRGAMYWWADEFSPGANGVYTYTNTASDADTYTYSIQINPPYRGGGSIPWTQVIPTNPNGYTNVPIGSNNRNFSLRPPSVVTPTPTLTRTPTPTLTRTPTPTTAPLNYRIKATVFDDTDHDGIRDIGETLHTVSPPPTRIADRGSSCSNPATNYTVSGGELTLSYASAAARCFQLLPKVGYTLSTGNVKTVAPSVAITTVNFGLYPTDDPPPPPGFTYTIQGTVYQEQSDDMCSSLQSISGSPQTKITLISSVGPVNDTTFSGRTYLLSGLANPSDVPFRLEISRTGYSLKAVKIGAGGWVNYEALGSQVEIPITTTQVDFCLENEPTSPPWFQT